VAETPTPDATRRLSTTGEHSSLAARACARLAAAYAARADERDDDEGGAGGGAAARERDDARMLSAVAAQHTYERLEARADG
jgi:hypothetical protein